MRYQWIYLGLTLLLLNGCITNVISQNTQIEQNQTENPSSRQTTDPKIETLDISGFWEDGAGTLIELQQSGSILTAIYPDKRGTRKGKIGKDKVITMGFPEVSAQCCTGQLKGDFIEWSDHTSWRSKK